MPIALFKVSLGNAHHRRVRVFFLDGSLSGGDGGEGTVAQVARPGVVEIEPDAAVGGALVRNLDWIAELGLEQFVGVGVDPDRHGAAPAAGLEGEVAPGRKENAAVFRKYVDRFQGAAVGTLARSNAERLAVDALLEDELALF